jgi:ABC-type nitrate/sulfonate/bicarbonate transport system substrate-binding protein
MKPNMRLKLSRPVKAFIGLIPAGIFAGILVLSACQRDTVGNVESIAIGMESTAVNSLIYIADAQKYFAANGLKITIKDDYPSGAAAVEGVVKGEVDVATAAEFVVVRQALTKTRIRALGTIDMFMHMKLIGRKDRGIQEISSFKGKRIGVPLKTAADFVLGRFMDLNGINTDRPIFVDVQAPQAVAALMSGVVDAVVVWQPNVKSIQDSLGDKASVWSVQSGQPMYCAAVTTDDWLAKHPDLTKRLLKSLAQGEDYLIRNPDRSRGIVQKRLNYDARYIETVWPEHEFSLRLDQSLILAMEDQARWMIKNNLTMERQVPDFLDYVYIEGLKAVRPEAVSIIR